MTSFSSSFLDDLRERIALSDVVGRHVQWDRRKTNAARRDFWACCPFHSERSPSFHVDDTRGFYKCFGCGQKGDAIGFLMATERLSFRDAVGALAEMAGIPMPEETPEQRERESHFDRLRAVCEAAASWFEVQLGAGNGASARDYLLRRGVHARTIAQFRLGYAPGDRRALIAHLERLGFAEEMIVEAGLAIRPELENGGAAFDRFRDRIIFPIADPKGRIVAFGGRAMSREAQAKYLNSPETPLFHKGAMLYNLGQARRPAIEKARIILAEGYMDVIALHEGGIPEAAAPLGTALTEEQLQSLWKISPEPILCFDGDKAGQTAAQRALERALPLIGPGRSLRFAMLPEGKDPDDLIRSDGPSAMEQVITRAQSLADRLWQHETEGGVPATPERRAGLEARLNGILRQISDVAVRSHYQREFRTRLHQLFASPKPGGFPGVIGAQGRRSGGPARIREPLTGSLRQNGLVSTEDVPSVDFVLAALVQYPDLLVAHLERLASLELTTLWRKRIKDGLIAAAGIDNLDSKALRDHFKAQGLERDLSELDRRVRANLFWASLMTGMDAASMQIRLERAFRAVEAGFTGVNRTLVAGSEL
jgi:DNA primase